MMKYIAYLLYRYTPRFMTEDLYLQRITKLDQLPDPEAGPDAILRVSFFNFFGYPLFQTSKLLKIDP